MEICTCHYKEDLTWLLEGSEWPVSIVHKEGGDPVTLSKGTLWTIPNVGTEAPAYLWYIIQRWDTLPDYVAFIHGHEHAHHQQGDRPLLEMIRGARVQKYGYVPLGNAWNPIWRRGQNAACLETYEKIGLKVPEFYVTCSGAQFVVSRERIRRNPLEFYTNLYNMKLKLNDCIALEFSWHVIFGEHWMLLPRADHFEPPLKEIKYARTAEITLDKTKLTVAHITSLTRTHYEELMYSGASFFRYASEPEPEPWVLNVVNTIADETLAEFVQTYTEMVDSVIGNIQGFAHYVPDVVLK